MKNSKKILFIDIETVSETPEFSQLPEAAQQFWKLKSRVLTRNTDMTEEEIERSYHDKAAIYAEFGKIICISIGIIHESNQGLTFQVKSFYGDDEKEILSEFAKLLNEKYTDPSKISICGHNIKEFDIPYLCRRSLIHSISLPNLLQIAGKKPWEVTHLIDTLELWRFGDFKHYTSLNLLSFLFNIPTPKDDLDGSKVGDTYWIENDLERIKNYCQKDVITVARLYCQMNQLEFPNEDAINYLT